MSDQHALEKQLEEQANALRVSFNSVLVAGAEPKAMTLAQELLSAAIKLVEYQYEKIRS